MTCTDGDRFWTVCPELNECCCIDDCPAVSFQHVRVVIDELPDDLFMSCDVILDSGADTSVLPLRYGDIGEACAAPSSTFVDAQGCPLAVESTRVATLQFGDVAFKEKFIVSDVTTPLVALGHIIRAGWSLIQSDTGPCLVKGTKCIPVHYRNNSLCARGSISMVSQVEPQDALPAVRVIQLGYVLRNLLGGWQRLTPQFFALRTTAPKYVDTTLAPADELMWLRTTLCYREGGEWEILEFCEAIGELPGGIDEEIHFPETVREVITLAHKYAMPQKAWDFSCQIMEFMEWIIHLNMHLKEPSLHLKETKLVLMTATQVMFPALLPICLKRHQLQAKMENHWKRIVRSPLTVLKLLCTLMAQP